MYLFSSAVKPPDRNRLIRLAGERVVLTNEPHRVFNLVDKGPRRLRPSGRAYPARASTRDSCGRTPWSPHGSCLLNAPAPRSNRPSKQKSRVAEPPRAAPSPAPRRRPPRFRTISSRSNGSLESARASTRRGFCVSSLSNVAPGSFPFTVNSSSGPLETNVRPARKPAIHLS